MSWIFDPLKPLAYGVILADPPWRWQARSDKGLQKSAAAHYNVMDVEDLAGMPVHMLAAEDCMLAMWATQAQLHDALWLMREWGFDYVTAGAWAKQSSTGQKWAFGTGYVYRSAAEFYLVGKIGNPRIAVKNIRNLIIAPVREHSRKPDEMHEQLERMFPDVPKCELFARSRRPGWAVWGNQTEHFG